jgi:hypothetical protein
MRNGEVDGRRKIESKPFVAKRKLLNLEAIMSGEKVATYTGFRKFRMLAILAGLGILGLTQLATAQENRGTITGVITDSGGAVLPAAKIEAKNLGTGVAYQSVTTDAGVYTIPLVQPGNYSVTASRDGFRSAINPNFEVRVSDRVQIDLQLSVGSVSQEVTVTTQQPLLETATATRATVLDTQEVQDLPLEGRTTTLLATLQTGVQYTNNSPASSARPFDGALLDNFSVNGGRQGRNNSLLNGITNTTQELASSYSGVAFEAPPDAVSQVRVQTSEYNAQYGHTSGGIIDVNTKSGTNLFHGSAYWFVRNDALNANTYQNNASHIKRAPFKWNQPGLEVDGPFFIPHVYNGRDRTFWMFSWERIKDAIPNSQTATVPTLAELAGDFSRTTVNGAPIKIYDPATCAANATSCVRQQFTCNGVANVICPNRINPVAQALAAYWPKPTPGAGNADNQNNYVAFPNAQTDLYDVFTYQVDQKINQNNHLTVTYGQGDRTQRQGDVGIQEKASTGFYLTRNNRVAGVAWSSTLSPTTVLSVRYGFTRHKLEVNSFSGEFGTTGLAAAGFPASFVNQLPYPTFPNISFVGGTSYLNLGGSLGLFAGKQLNFSTDHSFSGALTKIVNRHSITAGGGFDTLLNDRHAFTSPSFVFSPVFTQQNPNTASSTQGDPFADFLLGLPGQPTGTPGATLAGSVPINVSPALENRYFYLFVQDDWRVNSRLTLNLGLRWDMETPPTERYNRINVGFDPNAPVTNFPVTGLKGGVLFASSSNRAPFPKDYKDWQPRIGIAYKLNDKTVLRGGFAIFFLPSLGDQAFNNGFSTTNPFDQSDNGNITPANTLSNPYPQGLVQPTGSSLGTGTALGTAISVSSTSRPLPYVRQFSAGFQRQLPKNFVLDMSYVGSRTRRLETSVNIDSLSTANLALGASVLNAQVNNPFAGLLPGTSLNGAKTTQQQLLLPFPQFTGVTVNNLPYGYAWYNSLQARLEHRFSSGLFFQASLTYSKNMEAVSYLNPQDYFAGTTNLLRVVTADDAPYRLRMSGGYRVPRMHIENALLSGAVNGWQINTVVTVQSGIPVATPTGAFSTGLNPAIPDPTSKRYFNNCFITLTGALSSQCTGGLQPAWIQQPAFTLATARTRMSSVRTDLPPVVDLSFFKSIPIHERLQFQFRAEAFNLTNTAYFGVVSGSLTSATMGLGNPAQANDPRVYQLSARLQF